MYENASRTPNIYVQSKISTICPIKQDLYVICTKTYKEGIILTMLSTGSIHENLNRGHHLTMIGIHIYINLKRGQKVDYAF